MKRAQLGQKALLAFMPVLLVLSSCATVGPQAPQKSLSTQDAANAIKCRRNLNRLVLTGGIEDDFAPVGEEPARIRPARLPNPYLESLATADSGVLLLRDYDEDGTDKLLIDHFAIPRDIVSGALIVRLRASAGSDNDSIKIGNLDENGFAGTYNATRGYYVHVGKPANEDDAPEVRTIPFEKLATNARAGSNGNFIDYLNRIDRPDDVDFEVEDDTQVDVAILVLCQKPQIARGTSFPEFRAKIIAPNVSFLSCFQDKTQAPCNPFKGDQLCTAALPVACYKEGKSIPPGVVEAGLQSVYATGGQVKLTVPVPGQTFATAADVNRYCVGQFGNGWRVLDYHDGGGGAIVTYSDIPPKTRAWVNVRDQRYGNCWDRDKER